MTGSSGPPVSIVCPDTSNNSLGRALVLAQVTARIREVRVVGVQRGPALWKPAATSATPIECYRFEGVRSLRGAVRWLAEATAGTTVVVSKPRITSLGLARAAGLASQGLVLDIDDWEAGLMLGSRVLDLPIDPHTRLFPRALWRRLGKGLNAPALLMGMEALARQVPSAQKLVSNTWLKRRFGGQLLPHLRDVEALSPSASLRQQARAELKLGASLWAAFVGTPEPHKGLDDLVEALTKPECASLGLLLCGADESDARTRKLLSLSKKLLPPERLRIVPQFPAKQLRKMLSAVDIAVVPSREAAASVGQVPAKLFDALSMGLPCVATDVGSAGEVMGDAGVLATPRDPAALARCLGDLAASESLRCELSLKARQRALKHFDIGVGAVVVASALAAAEAAHSPGAHSPGKGGR